jgi:hypothetical protein
MSCRVAAADRRRDDPDVLRRADLPLDRETVDGIIRMLTAINAKLDRLLGEEEDDERAPEDES